MRSEIWSDPLVEMKIWLFPLAAEQFPDSLFTLFKVFHAACLFKEETFVLLDAMKKPVIKVDKKNAWLVCTIC